MCVKDKENTKERGKKNIADYRQDLFLNVLEVTRHFGDDGSEQDGIWTDT